VTANETVVAANLWGRNRPPQTWRADGTCGSCKHCVDYDASLNIIRRLGGNSEVLGRPECTNPLSKQKILV
jgi:hypothetical protein